MNELPPEQRARRARVIRTAVLLGLAALAIYATFIILVAERGQGM